MNIIKNKYFWIASVSIIIIGIILYIVLRHKSIPCISCSSPGGECDTKTGTCVCKPGYYSPDCSKLCQTCSSPGGICDTKTGTCVCKPGYYSPDCSKLCSNCSTTGGLCNQAGKCICSIDYYGDSCDVKCVNTGGTYNTEDKTCVCKTGYFKSDCSINCTGGGIYDDKLEKCVITKIVTNAVWPLVFDNLLCSVPCYYSIKVPDDYGSIVSFVVSINLASESETNDSKASVTLNQKNPVTVVTNIIDSTDWIDLSLNTPPYPQWNDTTSIDLRVYVNNNTSSILMHYISYTLQYYKKN